MVESLGLVGLFLGCLLAATVIPFASDTLVIGAILLGYSKQSVVIVATLGNTAGGMISFLLGWLCKWEWIEKYLKVSEEKLLRIKVKVEKYGYVAALFCWLPVVGDVIAIAMGLMRMRPLPSAVLMGIGKLVRYLVVAGVVHIFS